MGYWIIFMAASLEGLPFIGMVMPGVTMLLFFGFLSSLGYIDLGDVITLAIVGAVVGDGVAYYIGRKYGIRAFKEDARFLKASYLSHAQDYFKRHGGKSVFFGRFIGLLRPFVGFISGVGKMSQIKFWSFNISSALIWAALYPLVGFFLGENWHRAVKWFDRGSMVIIFLVILLVGYFWWQARERKREQKEI